MSEIRLCLEGHQLEPLILDLYENSPIFDLLDTESYICNKVYSDKTYTIKLDGDYSNILDASFFINGFEIDGNFYNSEFKFSKEQDNGESARIFLDTFGFVQLSLSVIYKDGTTAVYFSEFLNVMIREDHLNQNIRKMADYIYNNQEKLLFGNNMKALDNANIKESPNKTLESQLKIIKTIIRIYKENYRYFKNNSKFKLISGNRVDDFEKLKTTNEKTIKYIIQNPNELYLSANSVGIKIDKHYYLPKKTLINDNEHSYKLYENQVVLSFLKELIRDITSLQKNAEKKIKVFDKSKTDRHGYVTSAYMIYGATEKKLKDFLSEVSVCKDEIKKLFRIYSNVFPFECIKIKNVPKPTHTFLTIKQYRDIFQVIKKWYDFGIYNLERESFLIPFLVNNQLYEYFVLLKLLNFFEHKGYSLTQKDKYTYKPNDKDFQNTQYCNTFYYELHNKGLVLYYQPVIYTNPKNKPDNSINILRNTLIPNIKRKENYYLPDFIVKIQNNNENRYLVIDAKYSNQTNVKKHHFQDLVFKYLFSLSTINNTDQIMGLCAINGKSDTESSKLTSIYTDYVPPNQLPYADILTLTEDGNDSDETETTHWELLSKLLEKYSV